MCGRGALHGCIQWGADRKDFTPHVWHVHTLSNIHAQAGCTEIPTGLPLIRKGLVRRQEKREVGIMDQRAEETSDRTDSWCYCSLEGKGRIVLGQGEQGKAEARGAEGRLALDGVRSLIHVPSSSWLPFA